MPEIGTVKFFDSRRDKRFGFIRLESGEEIFFHYNDGEFIEAGNNSPKFSGKTTIVLNRKVRHLPDPRKGDILVFERDDGRKGPKASPWGYYSYWLEVGEKIANRPLYRVIRITTNDFKDGEKSERVIWQGEDLDALSREYPPSEIFEADFLKHHEIEDGWVRFDFRFERQKEDGAWEVCKDPRRRTSTSLTPLEREVDAYNRRRYPGDYMDDDYDDGYDDYDDDDY